MTSTDDATKPAAERPTPSGTKARERLAALVEWSTHREALAKARSEAGTSEVAADALVLARKSLRSGDLLLDPADGSPRQYELAVALFRESAYWLIGAGSPEPEADGTLAERLTALSSSENSTLSAWVQAHPAPAPLCEAPSLFAGKPVEQRATQAEAAQRWLRDLARALAGGSAHVSRLERERALRSTALLLLFVALLALVGAGVGRVIRGPDLAQGKPWRTSSTHVVCQPEKRECGGATTAIFFHTREEENPWYEIDLLSVKRVHRIEVVNRSDSNQERAVPLVLEVSVDAKHYFQVARRTEVFDVWNAEFPPVAARYVRATVIKQTAFHLERVSVR